MNPTQVCHVKVGIPARHFQCRMTQRLLEMKDSATAPDVVHSERMPESMNRSGWWFEAETTAKVRYVPQYVPASQCRSVRGRKQKITRSRFVGLDVTVKSAAQFRTEWNQALFASLAVKHHQEVVQVNIGNV